MTRFVLDASAGVELLLDTARGRALASQLPASGEWWVPEQYYLEVASALRRSAQRNVITSHGDRIPAHLVRRLAENANLQPVHGKAHNLRLMLANGTIIHCPTTHQRRALAAA